MCEHRSLNIEQSDVIFDLTSEWLKKLATVETFFDQTRGTKCSFSSFLRGDFEDFGHLLKEGMMFVNLKTKLFTL